MLFSTSSLIGGEEGRKKRLYHTKESGGATAITRLISPPEKEK